MAHVEADAFDGLLIDYVERRSAQAVIRGCGPSRTLNLNFNSL